MARGDGKARKGFTRGKSAQKMATGGLAASSREGGFAGAGASRLESPGQRSSVSPGGGNVSAGRSPGGAAADRDRQGSGYSPAAQRDRPAVSGQSAEATLARLGPNAVQSLTEASGGLNTLARAAIDYNNSKIYRRQLERAGLYKPEPKQITDRIEPTPDWGNPNFSPFDTTNQAKPRPVDTAPITPSRPFVSGVTSVAARSAAMLNPAAASARLGPNAAQAMAGAGVSPDTAIRAAMGINRSGAPSATTPPARPSRPEDVFGGFNYTPSVRQPSAAPRMMSSAQDYASIVPGSVSFTQPEQFQPFAQSKRGQELLKKSQSVMTYEEAQKLKEEMPPGTKYSWSPMEPGSGYTSYPVKVDTGLLGVRSGYTNIPNKAGAMVPGDIKVGTWNPAAPQAQPRATTNYGIQTSRAEPTAVPKSITEQLGGGEPTYTPSKDYSRLEGLTGPTEPPVYRPPTPPVKKPPAVVTAAPRGNLPKIKEGQVIVKDGRRYQMRDGKLYNFNIGQPQKREKSRELPLKDGGRARSDGIAYRGKTKGRYI